jgi:hypothetical protein
MLENLFCAMTLNVTAFSIMTFSITAFSIMTFSIMTFSIMTLSIQGLYVTQHNNAWHYAECFYAEYHVLFIIMLSVAMLTVGVP